MVKVPKLVFGFLADDKKHLPNHLSFYAEWNLFVISLLTCFHYKLGPTFN